MAASAKRTQKVVRDTAAALAVANAIYPLGWKIIESDTDKWKEGDGLTTFNNLPYLPENLTNKFNPIQVFEYQHSLNDTRIGIKERSSTLKWMQLLGIDILGESISVSLGDVFGSTLQSNFNRGTWIYVEQQTSIAELMFFLKTAGDYTATTAVTNMLSLYSYNISTRVATKVASTANLPNLYKTAGLIRTPLTSAYNAAPGLYLIVASFENTAFVTQPTILAKSLDASASASIDGHRLGFTLGATMPATIDMSTVIAYANIFWFGYA